MKHHGVDVCSVEKLEEGKVKETICKMEEQGRLGEKMSFRKICLCRRVLAELKNALPEEKRRRTIIRCFLYEQIVVQAILAEIESDILPVGGGAEKNSHVVSFLVLLGDKQYAALQSKCRRLHDVVIE